MVYGGGRKSNYVELISPVTTDRVKYSINHLYTMNTPLKNPFASV